MNFENKLDFTKEESDLVKEILKQKDSQLSKFATKDSDAIYSSETKRKDWDIYRGNFDRDIDNILNNIFYSRFSDKTQVHSFYKNDDLTRRALHVQLVSRIARNIGKILNLNLELIEAIAIGHDIGHTPFGHKGEDFLNDLYFKTEKKYFNHNVHSVKVLYEISKKSNNEISLQVLDGVLSHNGEFLKGKLEPANLTTFSDFKKKYRSCYFNKDSNKENIPNTVEGCLVRVCDIIAYLGKDRNDLFKIKQKEKYLELEKRNHGLDTKNTFIIKNIIVNLIKNSLNKPYIELDKDVVAAINLMKKDNKEIIYDSPEVIEGYDTIKVLFERVFFAALDDLKNNTDKTYIYKNFLKEEYLYEYQKNIKAGMYSHADIAVDYIACMTDDYFIDLCKEMGFSERIKYNGYFGKNDY